MASVRGGATSAQVPECHLQDVKVGCRDRGDAMVDDAEIKVSLKDGFLWPHARVSGLEVC